MLLLLVTICLLSSRRWNSEGVTSKLHAEGIIIIIPVTEKHHEINITFIEKSLEVLEMPINLPKN